MIERIVTLLYLSGEALSLPTLSSLLQVDVATIEGELDTLQTKLQSIGLQLLRNEDSLSIVTDVKQAGLVEQFWKEELKGDLTPAALQVLSLVAYLGNPTRQTISFIRGVQSSQSIRTLAVRGFIKREGEVCQLTGDALKQLGITSVEALPQYETIRAELLDKIKMLES